MNGMIRLLTLWLLLTVIPAAGAATAPDAIVRQTAEEVLAIIRADPAIAAGVTPALAALVEQKILPHFDFERMTQLAMARNWSKASPQQQEQLVTAFRTLLVRTYSASLTRYRTEALEYPPLNAPADAKDVMVKTVVQRSSAPPVAIDYRMAQGDTGWKVYDVLVEGVSLVISYRGSFSSTIERGGVDALIRDLAARNAANAQP